MTPIEERLAKDPALKARFDQVGRSMMPHNYAAKARTVQRYPDTPSNNPVNVVNVAEVVGNVQTATTVKEALTNSDTPSTAIADTGIEGKQIANHLIALLSKYVGASRDDLIVVTLWIMHTWVYHSLRTTPRLLISSIIPGSGKSTLLEWIQKYSFQAWSMSAISSASMLARLANMGITIEIDEVDRSLRRDNPIAADFIAVLNSGYKKGGGRPVNVKAKDDGDWEPVQMSTWAPAVFAGNNPDLDTDVRERMITIFLYPSTDVEDTDWELIEQDEPDYQPLLDALPQWAKSAKTEVVPRPRLDDCVKARYKEIWLPLARVAQTQEGGWLEAVNRLAIDFVHQAKEDADNGLANNSPHLLLLKDIARLWAVQWQGENFISSKRLCAALANTQPQTWGIESSYGKPLTPRRLASMLRKAGVSTSRANDDSRTRGYMLGSFAKAWDVLKIGQSLAEEGIELATTLTGLTTLTTLKESEDDNGQLDF
jgi:hypothetical protein